MNKLFRRGCLALSMTAAALALLAGVPAGAFGAGEESVGGSATGGAVVEPSTDSTQPASPAGEWSPQGSGGGASSDNAPPLQHGSSVGSGVVTRKGGSAGSSGEAPSVTPESGASYQPESQPEAPASATVAAPASTLPAESRPTAVQSSASAVETAPAARPSSAVEAAVGAALPRGHSALPRGGDVDSPPPVPVSLTSTGDRASADDTSAGSYALLLLAIVVLGLILGYAYVRLRRHRRRQQLRAYWREQDLAWETALRRAELRQVPGGAEPSAQPLQRINAA